MLHIINAARLSVKILSKKVVITLQFTFRLAEHVVPELPANSLNMQARYRHNVGALGRRHEQLVAAARPAASTRRRCRRAAAVAAAAANIAAAAAAGKQCCARTLQRRITAAAAAAAAPDGVSAAAAPLQLRVGDVLCARRATAGSGGEGAQTEGEEWWLEVLPERPQQTKQKQQQQQRSRQKQQQQSQQQSQQADPPPLPLDRVRLAARGSVWRVVGATADSAASGGDGDGDSAEHAAASRWRLELAREGPLLSPDDPLVRAVPGWAEQLQRALQKQQQQQPEAAATTDAAAAAAADATTTSVTLEAARVATSARALAAAVAADARAWAGGTPPGAPPLAGAEYQTLCAGELEALLQGARGVAMVQLHVGWDAAAPQPLHNPLALAQLRRALADPEIVGFASAAPGGLGLTLVLAARAEPFRRWAAHLAGFGAQVCVRGGCIYVCVCVRVSVLLQARPDW